MYNFQQQGILWTQESQPEPENIAKKAVVNIFWQLEFLEDIQARTLKAKAILK